MKIVRNFVSFVLNVVGFGLLLKLLIPSSLVPLLAKALYGCVFLAFEIFFLFKIFQFKETKLMDILFVISLGFLLVNIGGLIYLI